MGGGYSPPSMSGFPDCMLVGAGPPRLSSGDILEAFLPYLECEELSCFQHRVESCEWQWRCL
jgi:hypothetical protein